MRHIRLAVCSCALLILAGCGGSGPKGKLVAVQGKVSLSDGTALHDGRLELVPADAKALTPPYPVAKIENDGSYKVTTEGRKGAPLGKYHVMVFPGEEKRLWSKVSTQYYGRKSPLEIEVAENNPEGGYDLKLQPRSRRR